MTGGNTIYQEVRTAKAHIFQMEQRIREIELAMPHLTGERLKEEMETYNRLTTQFEAENGYACESEITGVLKGLGFEEADFSKACLLYTSHLHLLRIPLCRSRSVPSGQT